MFVKTLDKMAFLAPKRQSVKLKIINSKTDVTLQSPISYKHN